MNFFKELHLDDIVYQKEHKGIGPDNKGESPAKRDHEDAKNCDECCCNLRQLCRAKQGERGERALPEMLLPGTGKVNRHMAGNGELEEDEGLDYSGIEMEVFPCYP